MFVNSRLSSLAAAPPICNCTRAAHARVFRACNSIHDFKPIEFSFFLTQHSTYLYFISFPIYVTLPIFFFYFPASLLYPRVRLFINTCRHSATFFKGCANTSSHWSRNCFWDTPRFGRNFIPRVTILHYVTAVQCAPRISPFLFHECTYARWFLRTAFQPVFLSRRAAFKKPHFTRAPFLTTRSVMPASLIFFSPLRFLSSCARIQARSISEPRTDGLAKVKYFEACRWNYLTSATVRWCKVVIVAGRWKEGRVKGTYLLRFARILRTWTFSRPNKRPRHIKPYVYRNI